MKNDQLLIVGTMAYDSIKTPMGQVERALGGSATFAAMSSSYFKNKTGVNSIIGYDFLDKDLEFVKSKNINIDEVVKHKTEKTFFWSGSYHENLNNRDTLETQLNVLPFFDPQLGTNWQKSSWLLLGNVDPVVQEKVIQQMIPYNPFIALDTMNFWIQNSKTQLIKVIRQTNLVIINDEEARMLTEEYSLQKAAKEILSLGPKYVIIKKGEHGALLFSEKEKFALSGFPLETVLDPTGAGDSFAGGLLGYISQEKEIDFKKIKEGMIWGSVVATYCVQNFSTKSFETLKYTDIEQRKKEYIDLISL